MTPEPPAPAVTVQSQALVVDADNEATKELIVFLRENQFHVIWARDGERARAILQSEPIDVMIADVRSPGIEGLDLLDRARKRNPELCAVMLANVGDIPQATESMRRGAYDYQVRPLDFEKLLAVLRRGIEHQRLVVRASELSRRLDGRFSFDRILGTSLAISQVCDTLAQVAPSRSTVLLTGETGTGKDLCAQAIHQHSPRRNEVFVKLNCAALAPSLIEAELFGHEAGAFTGAARAKRGRFEIAHAGTLFLDEIGELPLQTQVKMLRFLEERTFERVGGNQERKVDVRVIAATNRDLEEAVRRREFRQDLYFRLNVVHIHLPSLRERREDIPILAEAFLREIAGENHAPVTGFTPGCLEVLKAYDWPGNVRELRHAIEQAVILRAPGNTGPLLDVDDFAAILPSLRESTREIRVSVTAPLSRVEAQLIAQAYRHFERDKRRTAQSLGLSLRTLYRKLKEYGID